ncbi:hypothetical protein BDK51DRAFT_27094 [Blyttiomyces helicus]|uniref:Uncharacterized protein n=1 Tax=Blyttiomyces helicus TaxID=388810 RepID=A0A4P9VZJ4_9FUNG|nr:hypothetical protein BDK51DRAFT_27094 [Blyttiomyces helicus]|eukprot:RKO84752.1 hypothetical protein BDK51DRAFT_27094 [Blyttiomyces helicus]
MTWWTSKGGKAAARRSARRATQSPYHRPAAAQPRQTRQDPPPRATGGFLQTAKNLLSIPFNFFAPTNEYADDEEMYDTIREKGLGRDSDEMETTDGEESQAVDEEQRETEQVPAEVPKVDKGKGRAEPLPQPAAEELREEPVAVQAMTFGDVPVFGSNGQSSSSASNGQGSSSNPSAPRPDPTPFQFQFKPPTSTQAPFAFPFTPAGPSSPSVKRASPVKDIYSKMTAIIVNKGEDKMNEEELAQFTSLVSQVAPPTEPQASSISLPDTVLRDSFGLPDAPE